MVRIVLFLIFVLGVCRGGDINVSLLSSSFENGVPDVRVLKLENDYHIDGFLVKFVTISEKLIDELAIELYRQGRLATRTLSNDIISVRDELEQAMTIKDEIPRTYLDKVLTKFNDRIQKFLSLGPTNNTRGKDDLPVIAPTQGNIRPFRAYYPMRELFLDLRSIIDKHFANIRLIMDHLFTRGWSSARNSFDEFQEQFRMQFLDEQLLDDFAGIVEYIFKLNTKHSLSKYVSPAVWKRFAGYGAKIQGIVDGSGSKDLL